LTCLTCRLLFKEPDEMRLHYKTDFHRFNLKRKVANLLPVTEELFTQKLTEVQNGEEKEPAKGRQHIKQSKQKNANPKQAVVKNSVESEGMTAPQNPPEDKNEDQLIEEKIASAPRLTLKDSMFDRHSSPDFESNLEYMTKKFGFFVPEIEYLKDLPGLIKYLGEKISIGNICIFCEKGFYSIEATRDHMRELQHCRMKWEDNEDEYNDFYDVEEANKRYEVLEELYVSKLNELVISNKAVGHRALSHYYKQKHSSAAQIQLMTSLLQEHKRLASIDYQKSTHLDPVSRNKRDDYALKVGISNNRQPRYRHQNPL